MRTGRPKQTLRVQPQDQSKLEMLARRPKTAQRLALRSRIVLGASAGLSNQEIARQLRITGPPWANGGNDFESMAWTV